jgi:hypothetical protein
MAQLTQEHMLNFERTSAKIEDIGYFFVYQAGPEHYARGVDNGKFVVSLHFAADVAVVNTSICCACDTLAEAIAQKNHFTEMFNSAIDRLTIADGKSKQPVKQTNEGDE